MKEASTLLLLPAPSLPLLLLLPSIPRALGSSGFESAVPQEVLEHSLRARRGVERRRSVHLSACVRNTRRARIGSSVPMWVRNTTGSRSAAFGRNRAARLTMPL